jgi:hypothetical protein
MPRFDNVEAINQELAVPMPYPAPPGVIPLGPNNPGEPDDIADADRATRKTIHHAAPRVADQGVAQGRWMAPPGAADSLRHDAMYRVPAPATADAAR